MDLSRENRDRLALALIGLVEGVTLWLVTTLPGGAPRGSALAHAGLVLVLAAGATAQLAWTGQARARLAPWAGALGLVVALPALWVHWQLAGPGARYAGDGFRLWTFGVAGAVALYIAIPFVQIHQESGRARFSYPDLFRHSWNNVFILGVAGGVLAIYWALVGLWAGLFLLLGVSAFGDLFSSRPFADVTSLVVVGFGLALGKESEKVVTTLRGLTLAVFRAVLPLLAVIALLFLATLPVTGLAPLWQTRAAAPTLLSVMVLAILFVNAVVQDATEPPPYPLWLRRGVEAMILALPIFAALTLYGIGLRIAQHGLMPERVYVVVFALVGGAFGAGYGWAVLRRQGVWMGLLRPVNLTLSVTVAALALLLHTPLLDPLTLSARQQYARLASGRVEAASFDYGALRFQLGRAGAQALDALAALESHPQRETIRAEVERVRRAEGYWAWQRERERRTPVGRLRVLAPSGTLPDGLAERLSAWAAGRGDCVPDDRCAVFPLDLDGDGDPEYLVVASGWVREVHLFDRNAGGWYHVGAMQSAGGAMAQGATVLEEVERGGATATVSAYRDLTIGNHVFRLLER